MRKKISILLGLLLSSASLLSGQSLAKGSINPLLEDFVPPAWRVILHEQGDLNKDGVDDHVLVIEDTNPDNRKLNDGLGLDTLNLNTRRLLVCFKTAAGYRLVAKNDRGFIPPQNDENSPCLADPLLENGGIRLEKGLLKIDFNYWLSCGSWYSSDALYTFRYQHNRFELIGFDHREFHRASGESSATSINYSTGKKSETSGGNMFEDEEDKPQTTWSSFKKKSRYDLEHCDENTYFEVMHIQR